MAFWHFREEILSDTPLPFWRRPWFVLGVIIITAISLRVIVSGQSALERGDKALESDDTLSAGLAYRESISWVFPIAPWREKAAERLWNLAQLKEKEGKLPEAVEAYSLLRAGFFSGRSLFGLNEAWREKIDAVLAPLMARWEAAASVREGRKSSGTLEERSAYYATILSRDPLPSRGMGLIALWGFVLWIGSTWRATSREAGERTRPLMLSAVGLVLFLVGVACA